MSGTATKVGMRASIATSRYGNLQPTLHLNHPCVSHYRETRALLHRLAARVEDATPRNAGWIVQVDHDREQVYLELVVADRAEAMLGLAVLESVAAGGIA